MRCAWILAVLVLLVPCADGATARIKKVLPHYLDRDGQYSLSPSLFERDAYQAELRRKPEMRSGLQFDVLWKAPRKRPLVLRVELRGLREGNETTSVIERQVRARRWFSRWSSIALTGEDYKKFGELVAWRASIRAGDEQLAEQRSFLW